MSNWDRSLGGKGGVRGELAAMAGVGEAEGGGVTRLDQRGAAGLGDPSRTNIRYLIRLRAHCAPSLTAALCQASVAERRARAPACALHEAE